MRITFLGAAGTVTGSKYLIEYGSRAVLVDCGLFQGLKALRLKNRLPLPFPPEKLDAVILTHAHLDHSGYLPKLAAGGFSGTVYCTSATKDLCRILLLDSAMIQEEEAAHARRHGYSKHAEPTPLYTSEDAEKALKLFRGVAWDREISLPDGLTIRFLKAGHILGAAIVHICHAGTSITFSGDLGRPQDPFLSAPEPLPDSDYVVVESTYGDRKHEPYDPALQMEQVIKRTADRGGMILIPSFAVGRTQSLLFKLWELKKAGRLPRIPIFVDSPMASNVTELYLNHPLDHHLDPALCREIFEIAHYVRSPEESQELSRRKGPMILISASGMATGGRVVHHLKAFAPHPINTILLAGYQAVGTRGARLAAGEESVKIHGQFVPVKAQVESLGNSSAHADVDEILLWLKPARRPKKVYITHGEPEASEALRHRISRELGWDCVIPIYKYEALL